MPHQVYVLMEAQCSPLNECCVQPCDKKLWGRRLHASEPVSKKCRIDSIMLNGWALKRQTSSIHTMFFGEKHMFFCCSRWTLHSAPVLVVMMAEVQLIDQTRKHYSKLTTSKMSSRGCPRHLSELHFIWNWSCNETPTWFPTRNWVGVSVFLVP